MEYIDKQVKKRVYRKISHRKGRGCEKGTWRMETLDTGRPSNQGPIVAPDSNYKVHIFDDPGLQKKRKKKKKRKLLSCPVHYRKRIPRKEASGGIIVFRRRYKNLENLGPLRGFPLPARTRRERAKREKKKGACDQKRRLGARNTRGSRTMIAPPPKSERKSPQAGVGWASIAPAELGQNP